MSHFLFKAITEFVYLRPFTSIHFALWHCSNGLKENRFLKKLIYKAFKIPPKIKE